MLETEVKTRRKKDGKGQIPDRVVEHLGSATPKRDVFGLFSHLSQLSYLCPQTSLSCTIDIYYLSSSEYIPLLHARSITLQCDSGRVFSARLETRFIGTRIDLDSSWSLIQTHWQNLLEWRLSTVTLCFEFNMSEPQTGVHKIHHLRSECFCHIHQN